MTFLGTIYPRIYHWKFSSLYNLEYIPYFIDE